MSTSLKHCSHGAAIIYLLSDYLVSDRFAICELCCKMHVNTLLGSFLHKSLLLSSPLKHIQR